MSLRLYVWLCVGCLVGANLTSDLGVFYWCLSFAASSGLMGLYKLLFNGI